MHLSLRSWTTMIVWTKLDGFGEYKIKAYDAKILVDAGAWNRVQFKIFTRAKF